MKLGVLPSEKRGGEKTLILGTGGRRRSLHLRGKEEKKRGELRGQEKKESTFVLGAVERKGGARLGLPESNILLREGT